MKFLRQAWYAVAWSEEVGGALRGGPSLCPDPCGAQSPWNNDRCERSLHCSARAFSRVQARDQQHR